MVTVITNDWVQTYIDGIELTTDYLNYWGKDFRLQNSAEGFNLGYRHKGFYQWDPSIDFSGDMTILDFISNKDTTLCIGGMGAGAAYIGQNDIETPAGTQVKDLKFYDVPLTASQISKDGITLPANYKEADLKAEGGTREKYAVIPDEELDPPIIEVEKPLKKGDVNKDGEITVEDALLILKHVVGLSTLDEETKGLADTDGNGQITTNDALQVLKYAVGLIEQFEDGE